MKFDESRAQVEIGLEEEPQRPAREVGEESLRVLILGDFGGTRRQESAPLARRTVWRLDRDGIDAAIAGIAPEISLTIDPGAEPEVFALHGLEDFHPDRLLERVPMLARLRALRAELAWKSVV